MAVTGIGVNYNGIYENRYAPQKKETEKREETAQAEAEQKSSGTSRKRSNEEYLKSLQKYSTSFKLETGTALSMTRDKKAILTVNPMLLEKMQNDPEAAEKYTQLIKDIDRAEKTVNAFYNAQGGCVERTSHWYIDENGNYYHFAYTRRDDRLNKKIREEAEKSRKELIDKIKDKTVEMREEMKEKLAEKAEKKEKEVEIKPTEKTDKMLRLEKLLKEKYEKGDTLFDNDEIGIMLEAAREQRGEQGGTDSVTDENMDIKV